jgi:hypothetical protein
MNRECEGFGVRTIVNSEVLARRFGNDESPVSVKEVGEACLTDGSAVK